MVFLVAAVGVTSLAVTRDIGNRVAELRSSGGLDLRRVDLGTVGLEIEGYWDPSGIFVATETEVLPGLRRPKLRGRVEAVDPEGGTLTLFGRTIHVTTETQPDPEEEGLPQLAELASSRIEVTCDVVDGQWVARKLKTRDLKASDKVKGTVTSTDLDGPAPETVSFHGLVVALSPAEDGGAESALQRVGTATNLTLALQECLAAAHELGGRFARAGEFDEDRDTRASTTTRDRFIQATGDVAHYLEQARSPAELARNAHGKLLVDLADRQRELMRRAEALDTLFRQDTAAARAFLGESFEPAVQATLPLAYALLDHAKDELAEELRAIHARAGTTTNVGLGTSLVAILVATVLGGLVWRSVSRPVEALHNAAVSIGRGHAETRVRLDSDDEFGVLAEAFNRMLDELAASTVSVGELQNVFDSMDTAVILLDGERRITNVNRATALLVGKDREDLVGLELASMIRGADGAAGHPDEATEHELVHTDGARVPIALSIAELRTRDGELQGYVCTARDLTDAKRFEQHLRTSLAEKELLLREVHHRVKNNMQVISSLLAMQSRSADDAQVVARFRDSQNRIRSMALIHEQLYQSTDLAEIDVEAYLTLLTGNVLQSFGATESVEVTLEIENLPLNIDQSLTCGLIVNELLANASKHAFAAGVRGHVRIALLQTEAGWCELVVADDGCGFDPASAEGTTSLGLSLVRTLARQLRGQATLNTVDGVEARIAFPLEAREEAMP